MWDLTQGNPHIITRFPAPDAIKGYASFQADPARLVQALNYSQIRELKIPLPDLPTQRAIVAEIEAEQT